MERIATSRDGEDPGVAAGRTPPFHTFLGLARYLTFCGLAGLAAGVVVGGVGARLFMRIAGAAGGERARGATTEAGFTVGEITLGGTIGLVLFLGIFVGIAGATFYVVFRPWLAWAGPWRGVAFGIVAFAVASATSDVLNPDNADFVILGNEPLVVGMILAMFVAFGAMIDALSRWFDRKLPEAEGNPVASVSYAVVAGLGAVLGTMLLIQAMFTRSTCDCEPPIVVAGFVVVAAAGTLAWFVTAFPSSAPLPTVARSLGLIGLVGAVSSGLLRAIGDATEVLLG